MSPEDVNASLELLLAEVRACRQCADLPLGPRPVVRAAASARLLIVGQAPGTRVHASGIPWNDPSGERLRAWMGINRDVFYDLRRIAIIPMGLCYPGKGRAGDLPPRPECAPLWHASLLAQLPRVELVLAIGTYAQAHYIGTAVRENLTATVRAAPSYGPHLLPLPHPSPRNQVWLARNPWFAEEVLPLLRQRVSEVLRKD